MENNSLTIYTADGKEVTIPKGGVTRMLRKPINQGSDYEPVWQIIAAQPNDERLPKMAFGKLWAMKSVRNDKGEFETKTIELGTQIAVYPVGTSAARLMMEPNKTYQRGVKMEAVCKSTNFVIPDADFAGKEIKGTNGVIALQCAQFNENGDIVDLCPMAKWIDGGVEKDAKGNVILQNGKPKHKWIKPLCRKQYKIGVAIEIEGKLELAELILKGALEKIGFETVIALNEFQDNGLSIWDRPMSISWEVAGAGANAKPMLLPQKETGADYSRLIILSEEYEKLNERRQEFAKRDKTAPANTETQDDDVPFTPDKESVIPSSDKTIDTTANAVI